MRMGRVGRTWISRRRRPRSDHRRGCSTLTEGQGQAHAAGVLTIGPFSRLAGVSPKMLRTYDALGLFRPVWLERATGYRYYSPAQLPEIRRILALRDLGIGLAEIAGLVDGGTDLRQALARGGAERGRGGRGGGRGLGGGG